MMVFWVSVLACSSPAEVEEDSSTETPEAFSLGPVRACPSPVELSFTEASVSLGFQGPDVEPEFRGEGGGSLLEDLNGDGHLDLIYGMERESWLHWGTGPAAFGPAIEMPFAGGFAMSPGGPSKVLLSVERLAELDFSQEDLGYVELIAPVTGVVRAPSVADFDGDGRLDFYVGMGHPEEVEQRQDLVFRGLEEGYEQLPAELASGGKNGEAFDTVVLDFDQDGWPDLYVANDRGQERGGNRLYRGSSQGLTLVEDCGACGLVHSAMGVDAADVNGDGWVDLFIAATAENELLFGGPDGRFVQAPPLGQSAFDRESMGWGGVFADVNNDGRSDLWVGAGDQSYEGSGGSFGSPEPPYLQLQQADGTFVDLAPDLGMDLIGSWRTTVAHDLNQDGVLDLFLSSAIEAPKLWLSQGCTAATWLEVQAPVMSRVEVHTAGQVQVAWVSNESSFQSVKPAVAHFGLGEAQVVERVIVELPLGGGRFEIQDVDPRRRLTLVDPSR